MLSEKEKVRYTRQFLLNGWGEEEQEKIKNLTVFVAGAGGTGSPTIAMLALMGVGRIRICDFDVFEETNQNRQFLHNVCEGRVGMNKAKSAALTVKNMNPNVIVDVLDEKLDTHNVDELVGDADMIFDCFDRFQYKFVLADCAQRKNIPMFFYGIMDYNTFGYIFYPPKTACFHCMFDEKKIRIIERMQSSKSDVAVMAPTLFEAAGLMLPEAVKMMIGYDEPNYNVFFASLAKRHDFCNQRGTRAFRFWMSKYFDRISTEQGLDWKNSDEVPMFKMIEIGANPECPHCAELRKKAQESKE